MHLAVSCLIEETAGAVWLIGEDKPASVGTQRCIAFCERPDFHTETIRQVGRFTCTQMNESGNAATSSALLAHEVLAFDLIHGVLRNEAGLAEQKGNDKTEKQTE